MDNFQFGYKQKLPKKKKNKPLELLLAHCFVCSSLLGGGWRAAERKRAGSMGPATAALRPCRKLAKRQGGEERKGRKEQASLSLSCCRARSISSVLFVLLTKSECVVASFFRRILGSPHLLVISFLRVSILNSSPVLCCGCVYWDPCFQESLSSSSTCRNSSGWIPFSSEFSLSLSVGPIAMSQQ